MGGELGWSTGVGRLASRTLLQHREAGWERFGGSREPLGQGGEILAEL